MPRYDGTMNLDQGEIEVIIGLDPDRVHLRAGDLEIGDWGAEECSIAHLGEGVYVITAENESLRFVPKDATLFEQGLNHGTGYGLSPPPEQERPGGHRGRHVRHADVPASAPPPGEAPPPKPATVALFYALAAGTTALGVWALINIL